MSKTRNFLLVLLLWGLTAPAWAAEGGEVFIATSLRAKPIYNAKQVSKVAPKTRVEVLESRGIWLRVRLDAPAAGEGWIRRFDVRLDSRQTPGKSGGSSFFGGLGNVFGGGSKRDSSVTSTIGIRGLDVSDLKAARPAPRELARMERYRADQKQARKAAAKARLKARQMAYLEAAAPESAGSGSSSFGSQW